MRKSLLTLVLALSLRLAASAQIPYPMIDDAKKDPEFFKFRQRLQTVVKKRDVQGLNALISSDIHYTFGLGKPGAKGFAEFWHLNQPNSALWAELGRVLERGGSFDKGLFTAPYTSSNWPGGKYDEQEWTAVVGKDVPVYAKPSTKSQIIHNYSYSLVKRATHIEYKEGWTAVFLPKNVQEGRKLEVGFVQSQNAVGPIDYRATFEKKNGVWKMTSFVGGD